MNKIFVSILFLLVCKVSLYGQVNIACDNVDKATDPLKEVSYLQAIENRVESGVEAYEYELRTDDIIPTDIHPFIASLHYSFAEHRPLSISPDMIWLLICQGFSNHIDINSEELRDKIVNHDGKIKILVESLPISPDFVKGSTKSPWKLAFPIFSDSIAKYINNNIHKTYVQSFSTTTPIEKAAFEISLMDGVSGYFEYEYSTLCGIPNIQLEGTKEDWIKLKANLKRLKGYNIDYWINAIDPIVQEFINAFKGNINHDFWSNIYKRKNDSGGPYITGWIIKFFPYINHKVRGSEGLENPYVLSEPIGFMEGLETNQFNNGLSKAEFNWIYLDTTYQMEFLAGFIGIRQDPKSLTLRPEIGWAVKEKGNHVPKSTDIKTKEKKNNNTSDITESEKSNNWIKYLFTASLALVILLALRWFYKRK